MLLAQEAGMTNGEYIYIHVNQLVDLTVDDPHALWSTGADDDELAKEAFRSVWEVRSLQYSSLVLRYYCVERSSSAVECRTGRVESNFCRFEYCRQWWEWELIIFAQQLRRAECFPETSSWLVSE